MTRHIANRLAAYQSTATQLVTLGGNMRPPMVTNDIDDPIASTVSPPDVEVSRKSQQETAIPLTQARWRQLRGSTEGRNPFGSSAAYDLWQGHRLRARGGPVTHELESVVEYRDHTVRLRVRLPDVRFPARLTIGDLTCLIPPLGPRALLRIDLAEDRCTAVEVDDLSPGLVGQAAAAWHRYVDGDVAIDTEPLPWRVLEGASSTPYPALVAALIQLRTGVATEADLSSLATIYRSWIDFRVLLTELRLRAAATSDEVPARAEESFPQGFVMPYSAEAFGYLAAHAKAAATSRAVVAEAVAAFQPGGFFCLSAAAM